MGTVLINGQESNATEFAWDTCHKIYLIESEEDKKLFTEYGYDFFPIQKLEQAWNDSCDLRFISHGDVELEDFVSQLDKGQPVIEFSEG